MAKSLSFRISTISMALLMLLSSTGFSMDIHYCQDQLNGVSLIGNAKSCHEKQETSPCHKNKKSCHYQDGNAIQAEKDNCCHNETVVIEKSDLDVMTPQITTIQDIQLGFVTAFVKVFLFNYNVQADFQAYTQYKPPLPDRDVQLLYQTFLI